MAQSELSLQLLVQTKVNNKSYAETAFINMQNNALFYKRRQCIKKGQIPYLELLDARQDVFNSAGKNAIGLNDFQSLLAKVNTYQVFNGRWSYALVN